MSTETDSREVVARSPYRGRPGRTFWKRSIAGRDITDLQGMYTKKFEIAPSSSVATAGSCFAQHISRYFRAAGYNVMDAEPGTGNVDSELLREHGRTRVLRRSDLGGFRR